MRRRSGASGCCVAVDEEWCRDALLGCPLRFCRFKMMLMVRSQTHSFPEGLRAQTSVMVLETKRANYDFLLEVHTDSALDPSGLFKRRASSTCLQLW